MRRVFIPIITAALIAGAGFSGPVQAQQASGSITFTPFKIDGLVVGNRYVIDEAFSKQFNIAVPVGYQFIAPRNAEQKIFVKEKPGGDAAIKLFFTTKADQVQSLIQFVPMTVSMGQVNDRLKFLQGIVKTAFLSAVANNSDARVNVMQYTKIGPYPAVEMIGNYPDPADGVIIRQIIDIPHPSSEHGVLVIINALAKNLNMTKAEDIRDTSAFRALGSFKFLDN